MEPIAMEEIYSSTTMGLQNETSSDYGENNGHEFQDIEQEGSNGLQGPSGKPEEGEYEDCSSERTQILSSLETVKEALGNELMKFREIRKDNNTAQDLRQKLQDIDQTSKHSTSMLESSESKQEFSSSSHCVLDHREEEADPEELFVRKIEDDVQYLVFRLTSNSMKVAALDLVSILKEQDALITKQTQLLKKIGDTENKALLLNKKMENFQEEITAETSKIQQMSVVKCISYFFLQLIGFMIMLAMFIHQISKKYANVIPT